MNSNTATALQFPLLPGGIPRRLMIAAALTVLADWLFYDHRLGISVVLFLLVLASLSLLTNPVHAGPRQTLLAAAAVLVCLASIVEELNLLSAVLGIVAVTLAVSALTNPFMDSLRDRFAALRSLLLFGPFRIFSDIVESSKWSLTLRHVTVWIVPVLLSGIFLALFSSANPLIESWFSAIDPRTAASRLSVARLLFWTVALCVVWPFIYMKWIRNDAAESWNDAAEPKAPDEAPSELFGAAAILRSLVLFNLLFAIQTVLDLIYLWGGVALPDGLTYAAYAHRGAYPLIATALLAAGFVLAAMRPGGPAERMPIMRTLVFLWIAQNVMLVISSILRLDLYVQIYSLTYWRVAAFLWMLLVVAGLVLIVARIAFDRSNGWLVRMNLSALALMAYICAFINFPYVIATYNVDHSKEVSGNGQTLDFSYLVSLGPQALPAIDRYLTALPNDYVGDKFTWHRDQLVTRHLAELDSWRAWSFRGYRLKRYIAVGGPSATQGKPAARKGDQG